MNEHYGYTAQQWQELNDAAWEYLVDVAARRSLTTYSELAAHLRSTVGAAMEPHDYAMGELLRELVDRSWAEEGVLITALVTYSGNTMAGRGLFTAAQNHKLLPVGRLTARVKRDFVDAHVGAVHEAYAR